MLDAFEHLINGQMHLPDLLRGAGICHDVLMALAPQSVHIVILWGHLHMIPVNLLFLHFHNLLVLCLLFSFE
jgi:hypothetical protein